MRIFRFPLIVLFSMLLDVATPPAADSTVLDQWEEALHRPRHNISAGRIDALFPSNLQRSMEPANTKSSARVPVDSRGSRAFQPVRKTLRLTADPPPSPEEH
ncbi:MAG: hypothetical protein DMG15_14125 [Acidobacteria bacterium]|nr:MAG: hypothetical protein DMG15_14125 [Acidobacteriota bacterium]